MVRTTRLIALALGLVGFAGCGGWLRQSSSKIEARLLVETPLTSTIEQVRGFSRQKNREVSAEGQLTDNVLDYPVPRSEGASYLRVELGSYRPIFTVDVSAFYIFDAEGRLSAVHVEKYADSI